LNYPVHEQPTSTTGLLKRFGRFKGYTKQGINIINPITESVMSVSMRTKTLQLRQTAISSDNIQFGVETILFYRIVEPSHLLFRLGTEMEEVRMCVMEIGKGVVRYLVGKYQLQDVIEKREEIGQWLVEQLNEELKIWGLYIEKANIKGTAC
jgi:regulator of protease activity HflC (stomatin/prohibitin superfamily)